MARYLCMSLKNFCILSGSLKLNLAFLAINPWIEAEIPNSMPLYSLKSVLSWESLTNDRWVVRGESSVLRTIAHSRSRALGPSAGRIWGSLSLEFRQISGKPQDSAYPSLNRSGRRGYRGNWRPQGCTAPEDAWNLSGKVTPAPWSPLSSSFRLRCQYRLWLSLRTPLAGKTRGDPVFLRQNSPLRPWRDSLATWRTLISSSIGLARSTRISRTRLQLCRCRRCAQKTSQPGHNQGWSGFYRFKYLCLIASLKFGMETFSIYFSYLLHDMKFLGWLHFPHPLWKALLYWIATVSL